MKKLTWLTWAAIAGTALAAVLAPSGMRRALAAGSSAVVRVGSGSLQGDKLGAAGAVFKGIPFAAPPVGPLRWREPMRVPGWKGLRTATQYRSACAQPDMGWNSSLVPTASEDCLYLNVWTPRLDRAAHLPVMVWIHGGAFAGGSGMDPMFDGGRLSARGVVLVTLNYRLGVLGFFSHPQLGAGVDSASGNFGLLDQIAALQWVRDNIERFGGDPAAVTIFGQSAGGGSVMALLTSPLARGTFRSAIVESGATLGPQPATTLAAARAIGEKFADKATLEQLRALPTNELLQRWGAFMAGGPQGGAEARPPIQTGPIIDGHVLTEDPTAAFAAGQEQKVPLIIGNNAREGFGRIPEARLPQIIQGFYGADAAAVLPEYAPSSGTQNAALGTPANQWLTDTTFRCGAVTTAGRHSATGAPVYSYQFEQSLPGHLEEGAQHSFELPYVFGNLLTGGVLGGAYTASDRALSDAMGGYWTNFAKTGDPNGPGLPAWPPFDSASRAYMRFATSYTADASVGHGLRQSACSAFERKLMASPGPPPGFNPAEMRAAMEAFNKMPDTAGTGKYPALKEEVGSLPDHVIYRPADLTKLGTDKLGVLAWGNGGCSADGAGARLHLAEIASHGYLAIANGSILSGPGAPPAAEPAMPAAGGAIPPPATKAAGLTEAIDWALKENARAGSPYFGRINPRWIAVSGWSCGGLQALQIAADRRVHAVIIHSSGIFNAGANPIPGMDLNKGALAKLHTPVIYILGGPTDIAYANGEDDFKRIEHVPVMVANLDVGHGGTFMQPNGGLEASVAVSWLDWQLKGDAQAAKRFMGADCGLCEDPRWKIQRKNLETGVAR